VILRLGGERRDEIVDTLVEAFMDYPAMRFMVDDGTDAYERRLRALIGLYADARLERGAPVLGIEVADTLAAIALVDEPSRPPLPIERDRSSEDVRATLDDEAWRRMEAFETAVADLEPDEPHHYVGMIGVRDRHRRTGLARRLLEEITRMSVEDNGSRAVILSTETPENLPFYEHFGFEVVGDAWVEDLHSWTLRLCTS